MKHGRENEPAALKAFEKKAGREVKGKQHFKNPEGKVVIPDGRTASGGRPVEVKSPYPRSEEAGMNIREIAENRAEDNWILNRDLSINKKNPVAKQLLGQLEATGKEQGWLHVDLNKDGVVDGETILFDKNLETVSRSGAAANAPPASSHGSYPTDRDQGTDALADELGDMSIKDGR